MHTQRIVTRRNLLKLGALSALGWAGTKTALGGVSVTTKHGTAVGDTLVTIFLRGGADGLSVVVPHGDAEYYRNRPTLALGRRDVVNLDGFFGLHPALRPLLPLYEAGQMAIVHACGSGDQTRSHFEAMATMERGAFGQTGPASGWLARHLESAPWENGSPLRAVAIGTIVPETLRGASNATALHTVADVRLNVPGARGAAMMDSLAALYGRSDDALTGPGREALAVLKTLRGLSPTAYKSAAVYPTDELGDGLRQVALLMKSGVGLEAACLDWGGFDTHVAQGTTGGLLAARLRPLALALAAFAADLGPTRWAKTTVVVQSEFGRRVEENSGAGTDHGRAGVMLLLGGSVVGGKVHGVWPGLAPDNLEGPGDLRVTTDYRDVLAEVIARRLKNPRIGDVFPGLAARSVGAVHA